MNTKHHMWLRLYLGHTTTDEFIEEENRIADLRIGDDQPLVYTSNILTRTIEIYIDDVPLKMINQLTGKNVNGADLIQKKPLTGDS